MCGRNLLRVHQGHLENAVREIFPNENIKYNSFEESFINPETCRSFEIDIWLPDILLGFEFQDSYHFSPIWYYQQSLDVIEQRDSLQSKGAYLVQIPVWWDSSLSSLVHAILFSRPDLTPQLSSFTNELSDPISLNPHPSLFPILEVPDVGQVMLASTCSIIPSFDILPWWIGEKYDGIRCVWNTSTQQLYTRRGVILNLPDSFCENILTSYNAFIDSELWFGRGSFGDFSSAIQENSWSFLRMVAFDDPSMDNQSFEKPRLAKSFQGTEDREGEWIKKLVKNIISEGGEGIMMRCALSTYHHGRSDSLLKLKVSRGDTEALVINSADFTFHLKMANGITFKVESKYVTPKIGEVVTINFDSYSLKSGVPVNPYISKIRHDVNWNDVISDHFTSPQASSLNTQSFKTVMDTNKTRSFWESEKGRESRNFLENFATQQRLDPLVADTWYSMPRLLLASSHDGRAALNLESGNYVKTILRVFPELHLDLDKFLTDRKNNIQKRRKVFDEMAESYKIDPLVPSEWYNFVEKYGNNSSESNKMVWKFYGGSIGRALVHLYPDIGLDSLNLRNSLKEYWKHKENQKKLFDEFAKEFKFDPLVNSNWYEAPLQKLYNFKGFRTILRIYDDSLYSALSEIYPNIDLEAHNLKFITKSYYSNEHNRRKFFEDFAIQNGFDSLVASNWYQIPKELIISQQGYFSVVKFYGSYIRALKALFPQVKFQTQEFAFFKQHRELVNNRKLFFDKFAELKEFDPLVARNWYRFQADDILQIKGGSRIMHLTKGGFAESLIATYPTIDIDKSKFKTLPNKFWQDENNQREFFVSFANNEGFDPLVPDNWYNITPTQILASKGAGKIMNKFRGSFVSTLLKLFPDIGLQRFKFSRLS